MHPTLNIHARKLQLGIRWQLGNRLRIDDFDNLYNSRRFKDGNPKAVYYETETISF